MQVISWNTYHDHVKKLDTKLRAKYPQAEKINLIGIPRAGMLIALLLSYVDSEFYTVYSSDSSEFLHTSIEKPVVLIDDVLETGATRDRYSRIWDAPLAVLFDKSSLYDIVPADVSTVYMTEKVWLQFPYEVMDQSEIKSMKEHGDYKVEEKA